MEKDIALAGNEKGIALSFAGGKASFVVSLALPGGLSACINVTDDASVLIDQLEAIVAKALPATAAFDPAIFAVIKQAVLSIG